MKKDFYPKILIVDDTEANLFSLEDALEPLNVAVDTALSGAAAIEAVKQNDYSVVLLDVQMPVMDGFETAKAIFDLDLRRHPPVIFVTAISKEEHYVLKGYKSGGVDYLVKPLNLDLVRNKVRFCIDLHERILENERLIGELQESKAELQRSNGELQQFAYVASHDLQEPIRMVKSYIQLLAKKYKGQLDENADKYIGYALEGSERMQILVDDLLALSRVSSQGKALQPVESSEVLDRVKTDLKVLLEESEAQVDVEALPKVMADKFQLAQVFQNLISNAIKFKAEGIPKIKISAVSKGDLYEFSVADNGIGIDPQYFDQIFVIFQRLHTREKYEGSGIGLALCKKIVERHGGEIWVDSTTEGSTFKFTLLKPRED